MEDSKTYFVDIFSNLNGVRNSSCKIRISMIADGINHSVPTQKELQYSIRWVIRKNLVIKESGKYFLSEEGKKLIEHAKNKSNVLLSIWKDLENQINTL